MPKNIPSLKPKELIRLLESGGCKFYREGKGDHVAEVPALPGCFSQGKTYEEALTNIKEAIEGWFEVMESKQSFDRTHLIELTV